MKKLLTFLMAISVSFINYAQHTTYNDVAVVVNINSTVSVEIGEYFKNARNIPDKNIIEINCSTEEIVDSTGLASIVHQLSNYLLNNNLKDTINYIVTTKGIPLIYSGPDCDSLHPYFCSAVDSELTLLINNEDEIGNNTVFMNPYFNKNMAFSQQEQQIYLVTRLDAYEVNDVKNMLDRSGPETSVNKSKAHFIFDLYHVSDSTTASLFNKVLNLGHQYVTLKNWNSLHNADPEILVTNEQYVLGYCSYNWGPSGSVLNFTWENGSVAMPALGTSAFTFLKENNTYNELLLADHIEEGACGGSGTVVPYFFSIGTIYPDTLFDRYLPEQNKSGYNLAESFYMSIQSLGTSRLVIGDPKTYLVMDTTSSIRKQYYNHIDTRVYPNPFSDYTAIEYELKQKELVTIRIFNHLGEQIEQFQEQQNIGKQKMLWQTDGLPGGMYFYTLKAGEKYASGKLMKAR